MTASIFGCYLPNKLNSSVCREERRSSSLILPDISEPTNLKYSETFEFLKNICRYRHVWVVGAIWWQAWEMENRVQVSILASLFVVNICTYEWIWRFKLPLCYLQTLVRFIAVKVAQLRLTVTVISGTSVGLCLCTCAFLTKQYNWHQHKFGIIGQGLRSCWLHVQILSIVRLRAKV